jgi:hypothetical protein
LKNPYKTLNAAALPLSLSSQTTNLAGKRSRSCSSSSSITDKVFLGFHFRFNFRFFLPFPGNFTSVPRLRHMNITIMVIFEKLHITCLMKNPGQLITLLLDLNYSIA